MTRVLIVKISPTYVCVHFRACACIREHPSSRNAYLLMQKKNIQSVFIHTYNNIIFPPWNQNDIIKSIHKKRQYIHIKLSGTTPI